MKKYLLLIFILTTTAGAVATRYLDATGIKSLDRTKTWTMPSTTDTLVGKSTVDTFTNKTITKFVSSEQTDAAATGANATLAAVTSSIYRVTNASLTSVDMLAGPVDGMLVVLQNATGNSITINNDTGATSAHRIITGTGLNLALANTASVWLVYSPSLAKWRVVGGSGSGGGLDPWATATSYVIDDVVEINDKLYQALANHTSGTFATDLAANNWVHLNNQADDLLGLVPINNGGTGQSTASTAFNALSPIMSSGDLIIGTGASTASRLAIGNQGQILKSASSLPSWGDSDPNNMLVNAGFEYPVASTNWTLGASNTLTGSTLSSNIYDVNGIQAGVLQTTGTVAFNLQQSITPPAGLASAQGEATWQMKIPSGITDGQFCTLIGSTEQNCVSTVNDNIYREYAIPLIFSGASTVGVEFKTTATYASGVVKPIFDKASIQSGVSKISLSNDSNWASYTPVIQGLGTPSSVDFYWSRKGDTMCVLGKLTAGTTSASELQIGLPTGYTIGIAGGTNKATGYMVRTNQNGLDYNVLMTSGNSYVGLGAPTSGPFTRQAGNASWNSSEVGSINFCVPITGWETTGSAYSQINSTDALFHGYVNGNQALTANTTNLPLTATIDKLNSWSGSVYTVKVAGDYEVSGSYGWTAAVAADMYVWKNGSGFSYLGGAVNTNSFSGRIVLPNLVVGDTISLRSGTNVTQSGGAGAVGMLTTIKKLPSSLIVGSFAGTPSIKNHSSNVDIFAFNYGDTVSPSNCSASPCTVVQLFGNGLTSSSGVTRSGSGAYQMNFNRTYSTVACWFNGARQAGVGAATQNNNGLFCNSCSALAFATTTDSVGGLTCIGTY